MADKPIKIPQNFVPVFQAVSDQTGIPVGVLAAVVQAQLGGFPNSFLPSQVVQIGNALVKNAPPQQAGSGYGDPYDQSQATDWASVAGKVFGGGAAGWMTRFNEIYGPSSLPDDQRWEYDSINTAPTGTFRTPTLGGGIGGQEISGGQGPQAGYSRGDIYTLFRNRTGRIPTEAEISAYTGMRSDLADAAISNLPEAASWRQNGPKIEAAKSWATSQYERLMGRAPTDSEVANIVANGWTPNQLESYLRAQPVGKSGTVGQFADLQTEAQKQAQAILGRDATPEEVHFMLTNGIAPKDAGAFYEQVRDKAVWAADPTTYRNYRTLVQQALARNGITVAEKDIDPALVNQAATGKWTDQQVLDKVNQGQMPGAPTGTSIGQYTTQRQMAESIWKTYFPNKPLDNATFTSMLGMTPEQLDTTIRGLPSPDALAIGKVIPVGAWKDTEANASAALAKLGVIGRAPTPKELAQLTGQDAEGINQFYKTDPGVLAQNPGAQYDQSRQAYYKDRSATESAYARHFGGVDEATIATDKSQSENPTIGPAIAEPDWMKHVFKQGFSPQQSSAMFDDYFKRLGSPPTPADIDAYSTRSTQQFGTIGSPAVTGNDAQGRAKSLAGPASNFAKG